MRGRGRPPLSEHEPSVRVSFRLPESRYDALWQQAQRERISIGDVIRRSLSSTRRAQDDNESEK